MTQLIKLPEVMQRTLLSRSTIYNLVNKGDFPKPIKLSERAVAWDAERVDQWVSDRAAAS